MVRVLSVRLVASTAATMSAVPTGAFVRQTIPKFYNYWWLRSPLTVNSLNAWLVDPSGDVFGDGNGVFYSYGRFNPIDYSKLFQKYWWLKSPNTLNSVSACSVRAGGSVDNYTSIDNSFG